MTEPAGLWHAHDVGLLREAAMIDCHEATRQLWEYLDNTVDAADRRLVDEHLARCRRCCGELAFAVELRRRLVSCRCEDLPDEVLHRWTDTGGSGPVSRDLIGGGPSVVCPYRQPLSLMRRP